MARSACRFVPVFQVFREFPIRRFTRAYGAKQENAGTGWNMEHLEDGGFDMGRQVTTAETEALIAQMGRMLDVLPADDEYEQALNALSLLIGTQRIRPAALFSAFSTVTSTLLKTTVAVVVQHESGESAVFAPHDAAGPDSATTH